MSNKKVDQRIEKALQDHQSARQSAKSARERDSAKHLAELLTKSVAERFKALEASSSTRMGLTEEHRLKLLRSVQGKERPKQAVRPGFASTHEILRSRLRYKVFPLVVTGLLLLAAACILLTAYIRTPRQVVVVAGTQAFDVPWRHPDGTMTTEIVRPGDKRYGLVRIEGDYAVLRDWEAGAGYGEFMMPVSALAAVK